MVVALPDPWTWTTNVVDACGQWTMTAARTTATVRLTDPPHIDDAETIGMVVDINPPSSQAPK